MVSSISSTRLPARTSRSGVYFSLHAFGAVLAFDERAADVAIADQPLDGRHAQLEGHRVGGGLAGVRHGDDDGVAVERHRAERLFLPGQLLAQRRAGEVDAAVVERAGDVGEINPLEEAVGRRPLLGEALMADVAVLDHDHLAGLDRADVRGSRDSAAATLSLAAANSGPSWA